MDRDSRSAAPGDCLSALWKKGLRAEADEPSTEDSSAGKYSVLFSTQADEKNSPYSFIGTNTGSRELSR